MAITGNSTGTDAVVGTLAVLQGRLTYICGFSVSAIGGSAAVGLITIANTNAQNGVGEDGFDELAAALKSFSGTKSQQGISTAFSLVVVEEPELS
jgi:hypothetical protein